MHGFRKCAVYWIDSNEEIVAWVARGLIASSAAVRLANSRTSVSCNSRYALQRATITMR